MRKAIIIILCSILLCLVNTSVAMSRNNQLNVHSPTARLRTGRSNGAYFPQKQSRYEGMEAERHADDQLLDEIKMELEQVGHTGKFLFFDALGERLDAWACKWGLVRFCIVTKNATEPEPTTTAGTVEGLEKEVATTTEAASADSAPDKDKVVPTTTLEPEEATTARPTTTAASEHDESESGDSKISGAAQTTTSAPESNPTTLKSEDVTTEPPVVHTTTQAATTEVVFLPPDAHDKEPGSTTPEVEPETQSPTTHASITTVKSTILPSVLPTSTIVNSTISTSTEAHTTTTSTTFDRGEIPTSTLRPEEANETEPPTTAAVALFDSTENTTENRESTSTAPSCEASSKTCKS